MTDLQMFTIAVAIIFPVGMLLYSNSRISEAKETLRAELRASHAERLMEFRSQHAEIMAAVKALDTKLTIHELEHHK
jgi:hypothetical protein